MWHSCRKRFPSYAHPRCLLQRRAQRLSHSNARHRGLFTRNGSAINLPFTIMRRAIHETGLAFKGVYPCDVTGSTPYYCLIGSNAQYWTRDQRLTGLRTDPNRYTAPFSRYALYGLQAIHRRSGASLRRPSGGALIAARSRDRVGAPLSAVGVLRACQARIET
jgi:hypothetical protein